MNDLKHEIESLKQQLTHALSTATTVEDIDTLRVAFVGRSGHLTTLMSRLKELSLEDKRTFGPLINEFKATIEQLLTEKRAEFEHAHINQAAARATSFDVTASLPRNRGSLHIFTTLVNELSDIFISMGYAVGDGPEVETDYYNFQALNIPESHPARDMQDTFWLDIPGMLLRTHTSAVQIHTMESNKPPFAVFVPGRVYRCEATDASHDFMFMQAELFFVDKYVSMGNLLATAQLFLQTFFNKKDLTIRVRPNYYPFVEPGIDIDASCPFCASGCSVCKYTRWIEILGAGLIHPNVLKYCGIDPTVYAGFALGTGLERLAMIKYGINDIRLFRSEKLNFLKQF
ncbi:MAG: phenylalanine--tRNA ligase subunit alpha [Candidatus Babeliales bacterium]